MRLIQQSYFIDASSMLVASGVEGICFYKMNFDGATDKQLTHKLDPLGKRLQLDMKLVKRLDGVDNWVKGMRLDEEMDILFGWSKEKTSFYKLSTGKHHFSHMNLIDSQID